MVSPGFFVGNSTTIATTPMPSSMRTKVPRNSAINSAVSVGLGFMRSPWWQGFAGREVVYQVARPDTHFLLRALRFDGYFLRPPKVNAGCDFSLTLTGMSVR